MYDVDLSTSVFSTSIIINATSSNDSIRNLVIRATNTNPVSQTIFLYIGDPLSGSAYKLKSIGGINIPPGAFVTAVGIYTSGDFGTLGGAPAMGGNPVYNIGTMDIGKNFTGSVYWDGIQIGSLRVRGNLEGNLFGPTALPRGSFANIRSLIVDGNIGIPGSSTRPTIRAYNAILKLQAGSINADISTAKPGGAIFQIDSTSGDIEGSISTTNVFAVSEGATQWNGSIRSARDLAANVSIAGSVSGGAYDGQPELRVGRDFVAGKTLTITNSLANSARVTIGRNLAGSMSIANVNATDKGLRGQVIANASNGAGAWTGSASIGGNALTGFPTYSNLSGTLGGGAVGLVPLHLHFQDSVPATTAWVGNPKPTPPEMLQTEFNHTPGANGAIITPKDVTLRFYGPVRSELIAGAVRVNMLVGPSDYAIDVTPYCIITGNSATGGSASRTLTIRGVTGHRFMHGRYKIIPIPATTGANGTRFLYSDNVDSKPDVADFDYRFNLLLDCNNDGIADRDQIAADPSLARVNGVYLDECSQNGGCIADFNGDGFVEFTDFDAFVTAFEAGNPSSDVNGDGFLDFDDFDYFVAFFEEGC